MTLEEAIYKLKNTPVDVVVGDALTFALAKRLGIEALELYYDLRQCTAIDVEDIPSRLPSETEE